MTIPFDASAGNQLSWFEIEYGQLMSGIQGMLFLWSILLLTHGIKHLYKYTRQSRPTDSTKDLERGRTETSAPLVSPQDRISAQQDKILGSTFESDTLSLDKDIPLQLLPRKSLDKGMATIKSTEPLVVNFESPPPLNPHPPRIEMDDSEDMRKSPWTWILLLLFLGATILICIDAGLGFVYTTATQALNLSCNFRYIQNICSILIKPIVWLSFLWLFSSKFYSIYRASKVYSTEMQHQTPIGYEVFSVSIVTGILLALSATCLFYGLADAYYQIPYMDITGTCQSSPTGLLNYVYIAEVISWGTLILWISITRVMMVPPPLKSQVNIPSAFVALSIWTLVTACYVFVYKSPVLNQTATLPGLSDVFFLHLADLGRVSALSILVSSFMSNPS